MSPSPRPATVAAIVLGLTVSLVAQKLQPRTIFIEAVDASGAQISDLKATDLEISEGGTTRPVTRAQLGTAPMRIAFLVDTGAAAEPMMGVVRDGLKAFLTAFPGDDEIALVAIGRQPRVLLKPTSDKAKIKKAFDGVVQDGGPTQVVDGVRDTFSQIMKQPEVGWPVFVVVTTASTDGSSIQPQEYNRFVTEIRMKGTTVHAIVVQTNNMGSATEYAQNLAKSTGGSFETITASSGLADKIKALAPRIHADHQKMAARYSIDFMGDPKASGEIGVTVLRSGIKVTRMSNVRPF